MRAAGREYCKEGRPDLDSSNDALYCIADAPFVVFVVVWDRSAKVFAARSLPLIEFAWLTGALLTWGNNFELKNV
jgi:hypothetical protein